MLLQTILGGIMLASVYVLIALGLTLVFGVMRIINFAHGEFYMLGAFVVYYLYAVEEVNFFVALLVAMVAMAALGVVIERVFFRPLRGKLMASVMVALGMSITIQEFSGIGFGTGDKNVPSVFHGTLSFLGATLTWERLSIIIAAALLLVALYAFVTWTQTGRAMRAVEQDSDAAALQGIPLGRMYAIAMAISCALAGAAGGLLSPVFYVQPYMGGAVILKAFIIIVIGGIGSMPGAVLGGLILGFTESFSQVYIGGQASILIGFGMLLLVLLIRPRGLFGYEA